MLVIHVETEKMKHKKFSCTIFFHSVISKKNILNFCDVFWPPFFKMADGPLWNAHLNMVICFCFNINSDSSICLRVNLVEKNPFFDVFGRHLENGRQTGKIIVECTSPYGNLFLFKVSFRSVHSSSSNLVDKTRIL